MLFGLMLACVGCQWNLRKSDVGGADNVLVVDRYDQLECRYVTTGDFAALQQMNMQYPTETRMLVENVLQLGLANDPEMKTKLLLFFQDSTLQTIMNDVNQEFTDLTDVESQLSESFERLQKLLPNIKLPHVYTQIGSLDQSIVAGDGFLGISLDKYLGQDYPLYQKFGYSARQRSMMTRSFIVPDCLGFYLLSLYPMGEADTTRLARDRHMGKIQYVVNNAIGKRLFDNEHVKNVERYVSKNKTMSVEQLLLSPNEAISY